ncbi:MAG TPA: hypothetical protein VHF89_10615 [Solirubrobacteraceae bacterium]|nr:hypothetical protein [Solirubrobacteraceae bacterium]
MTIRADDGRVMLDEHVRASDFETEHFRRCLAERLWWATEDAEAAAASEAAAPDPPRDDHAARRHARRAHGRVDAVGRRPM